MRRKKRFTEEQLIKILEEMQQGKSLREVCDTNGIDPTLFSGFKKKNSKAAAAAEPPEEGERLSELEEENRRLERLISDLEKQNQNLKSELDTKW